jgi:hypothetical protein
MPPLIGVLISNKMATLKELQTFYGAEDAYNMLELLAVENHNKKIINDRNKDR